jgi:hypothetical protein
MKKASCVFRLSLTLTLLKNRIFSTRIYRGTFLVRNRVSRAVIWLTLCQQAVAKRGTISDFRLQGQKTGRRRRSRSYIISSFFFVSMPATFRRFEPKLYVDRFRHCSALNFSSKSAMFDPRYDLDLRVKFNFFSEESSWERLPVPKVHRTTLCDEWSRTR